MSLLDTLSPEFQEQFLKTIEEDVKPCEKEKELTGSEKKEKCREFLKDAYKSVDLILDFPFFVDEIILKIGPILIDQIVEKFNKTGWI